MSTTNIPWISDAPRSSTQRQHDANCTLPEDEHPVCPGPIESSQRSPMITVQEIAEFETFMQTCDPVPDGGLDLLGKLCAAARAGLVAAASDAQTSSVLQTRQSAELATAHAIADWMDKRAEILRAESPDNAAGVSDAAHAIRAGDWRTTEHNIDGRLMSAIEPAPIATDRRPSWEILLAHSIERLPQARLLHEDMRERDRFGRLKYGVPLTSGNGRNHLVDAYQELLDFAVYLTNELDERGFPPRVLCKNADGDQTWIVMPADVFTLHELLRGTIFNLAAIRLMIERQRRHGRGLNPSGYVDGFDGDSD